MGYTTVTVSCKIPHWVVVQNTNACVNDHLLGTGIAIYQLVLYNHNYRKLTHRQLLLTAKVTYIVIRKFFSTLWADSSTLYIIPFFTFVTLNPGSTTISEVFPTYWAFTVWLRLALRTQNVIFALFIRLSCSQFSSTLWFPLLFLLLLLFTPWFFITCNAIRFIISTNI